MIYKDNRNTMQINVYLFTARCYEFNENIILVLN